MVLIYLKYVQASEQRCYPTLACFWRYLTKMGKLLLKCEAIKQMMSNRWQVQE